MKKLLLALFSFIVLVPNANSQYGNLIFTDSVNFESNYPWIQIDTSNSENIWQIGVPDKPYFDTAYSASNAIVTDLHYSYPSNNISYFDIVINNGNENNWLWGEGIISFWHKFNTDANIDGGYVEVSYDSGNTWVNIINDNWGILTIPTNFYSAEDTILGGIPAFSGNSNGWQYSEFYWYWLALTKDFPEDPLILRFVFQSDDVNTGKAGWMIDDIKFNGYEVSGSSEEISASDIRVYPQPAMNNFTLEFENNGNSNFELFDSFGRLVYKDIEITTDKINVKTNDFCEGLYSYKLYNGERMFTGKILIIK